MTFNFYKADIHDILRLIAQVSNLNIVAADDVQGKVTLYLKNVPWDQALDIILQAKGLGKERIGNVLRIAKLTDLEKEFQEKISAKKTAEELEPRKTVYIPINYTTAEDLSVKVKPILSPRGSVSVDERTNTLIVKDIAKKIKDVKSLVAKLDTPTPEVLIESRIVEANKDFTREIGIKWGARYNAGPQYGNAPSSNFPNSMNVRGGATGQAGNTTTGTTSGTTSGTSTAAGLLPNVNLPVTASYGAIGVTLEQVADIFTLDAELSAMEDNGQGRVISSPRIATLDNKTAKIEQGLRIPYLKITEEGTVTTEFIEANLNMEVTPHVSNDKMINMQVQVSKDTPDWTHLVQGVPSIDKKEATTNVMVRDGGVTAIGGIFTIERTNSVHKVPFFGDIPILGWAFKNKRTVRNRKELLIFISPKLIPLKDKRRE
jgi:type IV pilus assembly protein PilQ